MNLQSLKKNILQFNFNGKKEKKKHFENFEDKRLLVTLLTLASTKKVDFMGNIDWKELFTGQNPVVHIFSHASPHSWLVSAPAVVSNIFNHGHKNRNISAVFHKLLYKLPYFSYVSAIFGSNKETFESLEKKLLSGEVTDIGIYPEGSNSFFGNGLDIQPFKSGRFIELALKTNAQIVLYTFSGPETWCKPVRISTQAKTFLGSFMPERAKEALKNIDSFVVPLLPKRLNCLKVNCQIYRPQIQLHQLDDSLAIRKKKLLEETKIVRGIMQNMLDYQLNNDGYQERHSHQNDINPHSAEAPNRNDLGRFAA